MGHHYLPSDILIEEVFPKLSVESLNRFKCVSKAFRDYINNNSSSLVTNHLRHHSRASKLSVALSTQKLFFIDHSNKNSKVEVTDIASSIEKLSVRISAPSCSIVGSCDGLLCLRLRSEQLPRSSDTIVILNPETREGRDTFAPTLPGNCNILRVYRDFPLYGFGRDEHSNDYKLVRVVATDLFVLEIDVFSRNAGQWKRSEAVLERHSVYVVKSQDAVLHEGCLYWLILSNQQNRIRNCLLSFDLRSEEIRVIDGEPKGHLFYTRPRGRETPHRLVKWKDSLAYLSFPNRQVSAIGFQMIDSDRDLSGFSWSGKSSPPGSFSGWRFCGISRDAFFVSERDGDNAKLKLVMCDPFAADYENDGRREVFSVSHHKPTCLEVHDFVPSLVSVYPSQREG